MDRLVTSVSLHLLIGRSKSTGAWRPSHHAEIRPSDADKRPPRKLGNGLALERRWIAPNWDSFQVPKPFSRACVFVAPPIYIPGEADEAELAAKNELLQSTLDELTMRGEEWRESLKAE